MPIDPTSRVDGYPAAGLSQRLPTSVIMRQRYNNGIQSDIGAPLLRRMGDVCAHDVLAQLTNRAAFSHLHHS